MLDLDTEFELLVKTLEQEKIEYAICSGMAMALHGLIRATVDIDLVLLNNSIQNAKNILYKIGYVIQTEPMNFSNGKIIIHRLTKFDNESEDFLVLNILEVTESLKKVWSDKIKLNWNEVDLFVIDKKGLIEMKQIRNSTIDIDDIKWLNENE